MPPPARRPGLSRDAVVAAAVALADAEGLSALSMRALAGRLGVEAMSLYHHVPNKEALLDAMVDVVFGEFHSPVAAGPWREELRRRSVSAREVSACSAAPSLVAGIAARPELSSLGAVQPRSRAMERPTRLAGPAAGPSSASPSGKPASTRSA